MQNLSRVSTTAINTGAVLMNTAYQGQCVFADTRSAAFTDQEGLIFVENISDIQEGTKYRVTFNELTSVHQGTSPIVVLSGATTIQRLKVQDTTPLPFEGVSLAQLPTQPLGTAFNVCCHYVVLECTNNSTKLALFNDSHFAVCVLWHLPNASIPPCGKCLLANLTTRSTRCPQALFDVVGDVLSTTRIIAKRDDVTFSPLLTRVDVNIRCVVNELNPLGSFAEQNVAVSLMHCTLSNKTVNRYADKDDPKLKHDFFTYTLRVGNSAVHHTLTAWSPSHDFNDAQLAKSVCISAAKLTVFRGAIQLSTCGATVFLWTEVPARLLTHAAHGSPRRQRVEDSLLDEVEEEEASPKKLLRLEASLSEDDE